MIARLFLFFVGLMYALFGIWSLLAPSDMTNALGVSLGGPNGLYEIRGIYGGISLGAASLCVLGAIWPRLLSPALIFVCVYMGGYTFARIAGLLLGDQPTPEFMRFVSFEVICFVVASILVWRHPPK